MPQTYRVRAALTRHVPTITATTTFTTLHRNKYTCHKYASQCHQDVLFGLGLKWQLQLWYDCATASQSWCDRGDVDDDSDGCDGAITAILTATISVMVAIAITGTVTGTVTGTGPLAIADTVTVAVVRKRVLQLHLSIPQTP